MTDEQIIRNAERHIMELGVQGENRYFEKNGYVAGAHSRDEEIEELKRIINKLDSIICSLDCEDKVSIIKQRDKLIEENKHLKELIGQFKNNSIA